MDVPDRQVKEASGQELLAAVVALTGLPESQFTQVQDELGAILTATGTNPANLTMDELRAAMAAYLEFVQNDLLEGQTGAVGAARSEQ